MPAPQPSSDKRRNGHTGRRQSDRVMDKVIGPMMAAMLVLLLVFAVMSAVVLKQNGDIRDNQKKILTAQNTVTAIVDRQQLVSQNGCQRLQLVRDDVNVQSWTIYNVIQAARNFPGQEGVQPLYDKILEGALYSPPTDCPEASKNPAYRFAEPVPMRLVVRCFDPLTVEGRRPPVPCS